MRVGNYDKSLPLYRKALRIAKPFGAGDDRLTTTLDFLGNTYTALGLWTQSERAFRRALPMVESTAGRDSVAYGLLMLDIGNMFGNSDRYDRAEAPMRESFTILTKVLPADDSRVAIVRASYAAVLIYRKRYRDAEDVAREGLVIERQSKESCTALGSLYDVLGLAVLRQGRYEEAVPLQEHALRTTEGCLGPKHPALVRLLNNVAATYSEMHKAAAADATFLRAMSIAEQTLGADHPLYGKLLSNYAVFLRQSHRKGEAKKMAARSESVLRESARKDGAGLTVDASAFRLQRR